MTWETVTTRSSYFHRIKTDHWWSVSFRIFGYGLLASTEPPRFSERMRLVNCVRIFGIKLEILKP